MSYNSQNYFDNHEQVEQELVRSGFGQYLESKILSRLKGISYLATMDYIYDIKHKYTRYQHSISVAYVALILSRHLNLTQDQTRLLVIVNLLHDIGHVAFSHAAETFVLERFKKYHHGLKRSIFSLFSSNHSGYGMDEILAKESEYVRVNVKEYVFSSKTSDKLINQINACSLNCDRIEGTNRSLSALEDKYIDPFELIKIFTLKDDALHVKIDFLPSVFLFWKLHNKLYNKYIYTPTVLVSEAMLTRALDLTFSDTEELLFLSSSDEQVISRINGNKHAQIILNDFIKHRYFISLTAINNPLVNLYEQEIRKIRFDASKRRCLEMEIGKRINVDKEFIITHLSFKKRFHINYSVSQLSLFDNNESIPASQINDSLYNTSMSGEVFEIFIRL